MLQILVVIRGFVAIFWFAVQTYLGSLAVGLGFSIVVRGSPPVGKSFEVTEYCPVV
ncbi:hypothetical protein [Rubrobacter marinus]|uniref:hypothetical protein n=1 Tax=Rubrobacter marinus TaxID=2653852 RepID=UPI00140948D9|nr:hypothetical protein [Rubrobacter marinus]